MEERIVGREPRPPPRRGRARAGARGRLRRHLRRQGASSPASGSRWTATLPPAHPPERGGNGTLVFSDGAFAGRTVVHLSEAFDEADGVARFALSLEPGARWRLVVGVQAELDGVAPLPAASFARELDEERRRADAVAGGVAALGSRAERGLGRPRPHLEPVARRSRGAADARTRGSPTGTCSPPARRGS